MIKKKIKLPKNFGTFQGSGSDSIFNDDAYHRGKDAEKSRILHLIEVYRDLFHHSTKEYKVLTELINKLS